MAYNYVVETGVIVAEEATIRAEVQQEFEAVFGADQDYSETGPLGKLVAMEALSRIGIARNNAKIANQINPNLAEGVFIDALLALTGSSRNENIKSTFATPPVLTGVAGTIIPASSSAFSGQNEFRSVGEVTIPAGGSVSVNFIAVENGAITAAANTLTDIGAPGVLGWETITNPVAATVGIPTEGDQASKLKRRNTLALNARTGDNAIISAINDIADVLSVSYRRNIFSVPQTIDGIELDPNSVYVCVDGGTDDDIALALLTKSGGAGFTGDVDVTVNEPSSGQNYTVSINRPTTVAIEMRVTVRSNNTINDPEDVIKQAVLDYQAGRIGDDNGFILDVDVAPFEIASAINLQNPTLFITNLEVKIKTTGTFSNLVIPIDLNQKAIIAEADISVVFG